MGFAAFGVLFEEWEEGGEGGAAPDVGVCYSEDPGVVDEAEEEGGGVD